MTRFLHQLDIYQERFVLKIFIARPRNGPGHRQVPLPWVKSDESAIGIKRCYTHVIATPRISLKALIDALTCASGSLTMAYRSQLAGQGAVTPRSPSVASSARICRWLGSRQTQAGYRPRPSRVRTYGWDPPFGIRVTPGGSIAAPAHGAGRHLRKLRDGNWSASRAG